MSRSYWADSAFRELLEHSFALGDLQTEDYDLIYLAGGHGTMFDFPKDSVMQKLIARHYEGGKLVAAICHGVGGLLHVKLSNGEYFIKDKEMTGFSWFEESLARRKRAVPFNLEQELRKRQPRYSKALIPMTARVVRSERLITGQNPFSSKRMAKVVMEALAEK